MNTAPAYGWMQGRRYHSVPGRLLVRADELRNSPARCQAAEERLRRLPGVRSAQARLRTGGVLILYDPGRVDLDTLLRLVHEAESGVHPQPGPPTAWQATPAPVPEPVGQAIPARPAQAAGPLPWHALPLPELLAALGLPNPGGLSQEEAERRLHLYGANRIRTRPRPGVWHLVARQLRNPVILLLLGAGGASLALGELMEAVSSLAIALVTTTMGVRQKARAGQSAEALARMEAPVARAVRDGREQVIPAAEVVPGDLILLEAGDRVPADARLILAADVTADESSLTGESVPVAKDPGALYPPATAVGDRGNLVFMGTAVTGGRGRALVVATGMNTEIGRIAALLETVGADVPLLQRRLQKLVQVVVTAVLVLGAAGVAVAALRGAGGGQALVPALASAVASIPQGLPITVTIALSAAVSRLSAAGALARRLPAVENLGSATVICTDKTGTLTRGRMSVHALHVADQVLDVEAGKACPPVARRLLEAACLCSDARPGADGGPVTGDATEAALVEAALAAGIDVEALRAGSPRLHEVPFSSGRRRMTVVCRDSSGAVHAYVKGAPEVLLERCSARWGPLGPEPLDGAARDALQTASRRMAEQALRVLAVAHRTLSEWPAGGCLADGSPAGSALGARSAADDLDQDLTLLGLVGLMDPLRPGTPEAVAECRHAGIRVVMLTGDHPATAAAVAAEIGLSIPDGLVLTGAEIDQLSDAELAAVAPRLVACARVAPEHKLRVVRALQSAGEVVAMTGDGVNDAPAIQAADIGIAMGRAGAEVTRSAAQVVLMSDRFPVIVHAVRLGRSAYENIRRSIRYSLATNAGEALASLIPLALGLPLPIPPALLLWSNVACDGLVSLSLAVDGPEPALLDRPPRSPREPLLPPRAVRALVARAVAVGAAVIGLYGGARALGLSAGRAHALALAALASAKLRYARDLRRHDADGRRIELPASPLLRVAYGAASAVVLAPIYVPQARQAFGLEPLRPADWLVVLGAAWAGSLIERAAAGWPDSGRPKTQRQALDMAGTPGAGHSPSLPG